MNKTLFRQVHLWLSVPFGLIVVLMCLSGGILLFERDFGHVGQAEVRRVGASPLPMDSIMDAAAGYLAGENEIVGVTTYPDPGHAYKVLLKKPAMAAIWVDQYTGEVIGKYERAGIFKLASSVHRRLFGKPKSEGAYGAATGKLIVGITTIALFFIVVTGFVIWWPRKGQVLEGFRISVRHGSYRRWHDIHCVGGVLSSFVLVICILTGLTWSFGWYRTAFYSVFGCEAAKPSTQRLPAENFQAWEKAYTAVLASNREKEIRMYQGKADVVIAGVGNQQAVNTYMYDPLTGAITSLEEYKDRTKSGHIKGWVYTLHVGSWAGWFSRIFYLLCVVMGAALPVTGYYLWIKKLCLKRK